MTLVMLAGSSGWSMFSPASTLPLAASITIHAAASVSGGVGTGSASLAGACAPGIGTGTCALARPTVKVDSAARPIARRTAGTFIVQLIRRGGGAGGCQGVRVRYRKL